MSAERSPENDAPRWWSRFRRTRRQPCPLVSYDECFRVCIPADTCAAHCPIPLVRGDA